MSGNPLSFEGRIRRTENCLSYLRGYFIQLALQFLLAGVEIAVFILLLCFVLTAWSLLAQGVKRCHDTGNSGWTQFIPGCTFWMMFLKLPNLRLMTEGAAIMARPL